MTKKCIIIPAYNEEKTITHVILGIKRFSDADIIVINDGSFDHTDKLAKRAGAFVISHPFNMGYGVALQTGYKFAQKHNYDILLQIDADGQHSPEVIPEFFNRIEKEECDVLIGSRFLGGGQYKAGLLKSIGIFIFKIIIRIFGARITDPTSGYQCMARDVFSIFTHDSFPCDYPDTNIIVRLHRMGFTVKEIPVFMTNNPEGGGMHRGTFIILYYFFTMFLSIFITLISDRDYFKYKR